MPTIKGDQLIVTIQSPTQNFICTREDLITFLRTELQNPNVTIATDLQDVAAGNATPYTAKEKLESMLKDNPKLQSLISNFNLDFE